MSSPDESFASLERRALIDKIHNALSARPASSSDITFRTAWACLWLADLPKLRELSEMRAQPLQAMLEYVERCDLVGKWTQGDKDPYSKTPSVASTPTHAPSEGLLPSIQFNTRSPRGRITQSTPSSAEPDRISTIVHHNEAAGSTPGTPCPPSEHAMMPSTPRGMATEGFATPSRAPLEGISPARHPASSASASPSISSERKRPVASADGVEQLTKKPKKRKTRSVDAGKEAHKRENGCGITQHVLSEAAHIYPFSMADPQTNGVSLFWDVLNTFWSSDRIAQWWRAVYEEAGGTERVQNRICMNPLVHKAHIKGHFALEPVHRAQDGTKLFLKFWYLKPGNASEPATLNAIPELPASLNPFEYRMTIHYTVEDRSVRSGDTIVLTTDDPASRPLPDTTLLEMQWILNRITALRGAAEPKDLPDDDSDDDSDDDGGLLWPEMPSSRLDVSSPPTYISDISDNKKPTMTELLE